MLEHAHDDSQTVTFLERPVLPEGSSVTSASVVAFTKHNRILVMVDDFGELDLPGGILHQGESPEEVIQRETKGEVHALITPPRLSSIMETDRGFMLSYVASLQAIGSLDRAYRDMQLKRRQFLEIGEVLKKSRNHPVLFEIVRRASVVFPMTQ